MLHANERMTDPIYSSYMNRKAQVGHLALSSLSGGMNSYSPKGLRVGRPKQKQALI